MNKESSSFPIRFLGSRLAVLFFSLLLAVPCAYASAPYSIDSLRCCDLLFVSPSEPNAITSVTEGILNQPIDHVAIYYETDSVARVIEAVPDGGVRMINLSEFLEQNKACHIWIGRVVSPFNASATLRRALSLVGQPYDHLFLADNDAIYCSELVQMSFVNDSGKLIFDPIPMSFHDSSGNITTYWRDFYRSHNLPVPEGQPGSNPGDLSRRPNVVIVGNW